MRVCVLEGGWEGGGGSRGVGSGGGRVGGGEGGGGGAGGWLREIVARTLAKRGHPSSAARYGGGYCK